MLRIESITAEAWPTTRWQEHPNSVTRWIPTRPYVDPFIRRLLDAWLVITGKAEAVVWPT